MTDINRVKRQDEIIVEYEGEVIKVYNWVNVTRTQSRVIYGIGSMDHYDDEPKIGAGDNSVAPEYMTKWVADMIWNEFGVDVDTLGITVIDFEEDDSWKLV